WRDIIRESLVDERSREMHETISDRVYLLTAVPVPDLGYVNIYGRDVTQERRKTALIEHMALHDDLTNLPNRVKLRDHLSTVIGNALAAPASLHVLGLDGIDSIHALFGHSVSDRVLVEVGRRLSRMVKRDGLVAALGGSEFAVVVHN